MSLRFLIVDDTRFMRLMLTDILRRLNHEVAGEAENGERAVALYRELKPDIVFMDISMPGMDGVKALELILREDPKAKIIICSAVSQQDMIDAAMERGAKGYVMKPFKPRQIREVIGQVSGQPAEEEPVLPPLGRHGAGMASLRDALGKIGAGWREPLEDGNPPAAATIVTADMAEWNEAAGTAEVARFAATAAAARVGEWPEKQKREDAGEQAEKAEQNGRKEQTEQAGQMDQHDQTERMERTERSELREQAELSEQNGQTGHAEPAGQADQTEPAGQAGQTGRADQTDQAETAKRAMQAESGEKAATAIMDIGEETADSGRAESVERPEFATSDLAARPDPAETTANPAAEKAETAAMPDVLVAQTTAMPDVQTVEIAAAADDSVSTGGGIPSTFERLNGCRWIEGGEASETAFFAWRAPGRSFLEISCEGGQSGRLRISLDALEGLLAWVREQSGREAV